MAMTPRTDQRRAAHRLAEDDPPTVEMARLGHDGEQVDAGRGHEREPGNAERSTAEERVADDGGDPAGDPAEAARSGDSASPLRRLRLAGALALVALLVAGVFGVLAGLQWWSASERSDVQDAARSHAELLLNIDSGRSVEDARAVLDASTGEFADLYKSTGDAYFAAVRDGEVRMTVDSVDTGVAAVDGDTARTLSAVRVTMRSIEDSEGTQRSYRLVQDLQKEDGRWLVSRVEFGG
ncbi:hypothetical protein PP1_011325 [Pseudonocardia sp. P1]